MGQNEEYLEAQVLTASPEKLHLMVINGAVRYAEHAKTALIEKDFETAFLALNKSREFVSELISGLKSEEPSEMIDQLKDLFVFAFRNLAEADVDNDADKVEAALKVLRMHQETWVQLLEQVASAEGPDSPSDESTQDSPTSHSWAS